MSQFWRNISFENSNFITSGGFLNSMNNNYNNFNNINCDIFTQKERPELSSIIGIGDCMVDIIAEVDENFIKKYELDSKMTKYDFHNCSFLLFNACK